MNSNFAVKLAERSNRTYLLSIWWITFFKHLDSLLYGNGMYRTSIRSSQAVTLALNWVKQFPVSIVKNLIGKNLTEKVTVFSKSFVIFPSQKYSPTKISSAEKFSPTKGFTWRTSFGKCTFPPVFLFLSLKVH